MGCDIHCFVEVNINGKWMFYNQCDVGRHYGLFAKMAGVRNYDEIVPISDPKGIPDNISEMVKIHCEYFGDDGHSHSWLSIRELIKLREYYQEKISEKSWDFDDEFGYIFGNPITEFYKYNEEYPEFLKDIRVVFWFDN